MLSSPQSKIVTDNHGMPLKKFIHLFMRMRMVPIFLPSKFLVPFQDIRRELKLEPFVVLETVEVDEELQRAVVSIAPKE